MYNIINVVYLYICLLSFLCFVPSLINSICVCVTEDIPPPTPLIESVEDNYITMTSAPPSMVSCPDSKVMLGVSLESAIINVLKVIEVNIASYPL